MELMGRSIQEIFNKFKPLFLNDELFYACLIILVAVSAFGLGRWSEGTLVPKNAVLPALIPYSMATSTQNATTMADEVKANAAIVGDKVYVASKSGTKYHLLTCPGAKQIKEENKIYFATKAEAEVAGYTPAANCPGLSNEK